ncbi:MAG TPA: ABC transporter permease, partial [Aquabacterium sp.]|nr:ABC transporter permease [Aquabacterium sp.]
MLSYILRRLGYGLLILIGVNLITFVLFFTVNTPDDMARLNIGGKRVTPEQIDKWKVERGYDKPMLYNAQAEGGAKVTNTVFWDRSMSLFAFRFGRADSASGGDIGYQIGQRMGVSLQLTVP